MPLNSSERRLFESLQSTGQQKPLMELAIDEFRLGAASSSVYAGDPAMVPYEDRLIQVRDSSRVAVRIYNSHIQDSPVLVYYPACCYIVNLFEINSIVCSRIAHFSRIKVIAVDFRLAPENPMPCSIYDAYDVTQYIALNPKE